MILTDIENLSRFKALSPLMAKAIEYIERMDKIPPAAGRTQIDGDNIFALVQSYDTRNFSEGLYETHNKYIDIQYMISGGEMIYYADRKDMPSPSPYNPENDKTNYADIPEALAIHVKQGMAAIFYPEDAHKACVRVKEMPEPVIKLILKVKV